MSADSTTPTLLLACPHCRTSVRWQDNPHRPFCSERCRLIDLGHWAAEDYRVADASAAESTED